MDSWKRAFLAVALRPWRRYRFKLRLNVTISPKVQTTVHTCPYMLLPIFKKTRKFAVAKPLHCSLEGNWCLSRHTLGSTGSAQTGFAVFHHKPSGILLRCCAKAIVLSVSNPLVNTYYATQFIYYVGGWIGDQAVQVFVFNYLSLRLQSLAEEISQRSRLLCTIAWIL